MGFITPSVGAVTVRTAGQAVVAAIGQYRPTGVPRLGSKEDRVGAYRRMLGASTRALNFAYVYGHRHRKSRRFAAKMLVRQTLLEVSSELMSALNEVRLCGTVHVIAAAENLVTAVYGLNPEGGTDVPVGELMKVVVAAQKALLDACREDLAYNTKWYQLLRRRKERLFLREQARQQGLAPHKG